jgi:hypothetical protein
MPLGQRFCRHRWSPWRPGLTEGIAESVGASEAEIEAEHALFEGVGFPGTGMTAEQDDSFEHRRCSKCGKFDARPRIR